MRDKLILNDNTEITIESASSLSDIRVVSEAKEDMLAIWDMLSPENLKSVRVANGEGFTVGFYSNLVLVSETSRKKEGKIETSFNLREKTDMEKRLDALETGQEIQDEAISDLGTAVSDLAEGGFA